MPKTLAQKQADKQLEEAILRACEAYKLIGDALLLDYVVVVEGANFSADEDGDEHLESYGMAFRHGNVRTTVAIGILAKGMDLLRGGQVVEENE